MNTIKRMLTLIGIGTILGFALWGLAAWDGMQPLGWIIAGLVIVLGLWSTWAIVDRGGKPRAPARVAPPPPSSREDRAANVRFRVELRAYGLTAFAAVGLFITGLSLSEADQPVDVRFLPDFLASLRFTDWGYIGLATTFMAIAIGFMVGALWPRAARWFNTHRWALQWMELSAGIITWTGVTLAWIGHLPNVLALPPAFVYFYFYGGFLVFLLTGALFLRDAGNAAFQGLGKARHSNPSAADPA